MLLKLRTTAVCTQHNNEDEVALSCRQNANNIIIKEDNIILLFPIPTSSYAGLQ